MYAPFMKTMMQDSEFWRSGKWAVIQLVGLFVVLLAGALIAFSLPEDLALKSRTEEGLFERLTIVFYGLAIAISVLVIVIRRWYDGWIVSFMLFLLTIRELDFHKRPTQSGDFESVTSRRYWLAEDVALLEKILIAVVIILAAYALFRGLQNFIRPWWEALRRGRPYAIFVLGMPTLAVLSVLLDKVIDVEDLNTPYVLFLSLLEESLELGIPIAACLALVHWARSNGPVATMR